MSDESPANPTLPADAGDSATQHEEPKTGVPEKTDAKPSEEKETTVTDNAQPSEETAPSAESAEKNEQDANATTTAGDSSAAPPAVNGSSTPAKTPVARRKSTTGGSSSAKKLSKKKSQQRITHLDAQPGEYYTARLKSYPPWPAIICDEEMLPQTLLNTRPVTTKQADGTYKEAYADGGKRVNERTFPIMFLETNEFAWIPNTDLTPLDPESCKDVPEKGKQKNLIAAYKVASENHDLQYFKSLLADHQRAVQQELEEREAAAAAKAAAKAEKEEKKKQQKKRKSEVVSGDAEDAEMADGDEEGGKKPKSAKKRKKETESDVETEKPAKTPKTTKLKLTTPKAPGSAEPSKKPAEKPAKASKPKKSKSSDEENATATPVEEPKIDPAEAKAKKEKDVLVIRHRLQKGFISRDQAPKEEEMAHMASLFSKLEGYQDLEVSIIRATKVNKVLKAIIKLNSIPKDEEYNFRRRALDLLGKWKHLLQSDLPADEQEKESKPQTNGVHKEDKASAEKTEEPNEKSPDKESAEPAEKEGDKDIEMPDAAESKTEAPAVTESTKTSNSTEEGAKVETKADEVTTA